MKRALAIFFLSLILFNTIGYYSILFLIEGRLTTQLVQKIDDMSGEISGHLIISFPLEVPNHSVSENYERVDGEIIYEGEVYRMVKQKVYQNSLYVVCVRDDRGTQLREEMNDYSKTFSSEQSGNAGDAVKIVISFAKYFLSADPAPGTADSPWSRPVSQTSSLQHLYSFDVSNSVFRPPVA